MDVDLDHRGQCYRLLETISSPSQMLKSTPRLHVLSLRLHSSPPSLATPVRPHASQLMRQILD